MSGIDVLDVMFSKVFLISCDNLVCTCVIRVPSCKHQNRKFANTKTLLMFQFLISFLICVFSLATIAQNITHGPVIGAVTDSSARVYVRSNVAGLAEIEVDTNTSFTSPVSFADSIRTDLDNSVIINLTGLNDDTRYYMRIYVNQQLDSTTGSFMTFPVPGTADNFTFVFGSCLQNRDPHNMFQVMLEQNPRFFMQLGDFTYPDGNYGTDFPQVDSTLAGSYRDKYEYFNIEPLLQSVPLAYVYDDHDYVDNNSGRTTRSDDYNFQGPNGIETVVMDVPLHPQARRSAIKGYVDYFPGYEPVDTSEGLYHSFRFANVEVFFVDNRSARSPNNETLYYDSAEVDFPWTLDVLPGHSILGVSQMQWLKNGLLNSTADWKFIASGTTFNRALDILVQVGLAFQRIPMSVGSSASGTGMDLVLGFGDGWSGFPEDQDTLVNFVRRNELKNIIMLTGDTHTSAMDDGTNAGLPEFNSSCMTVKSSSIKLYHLVDSIGQSLLGQPAVLDSMWNKGGAGLGNTNYNPGFGRVEVFGSDSIRMCQIDSTGEIVMCWTMADGFQPTTFTDWGKTLNHPDLQVFPNPAENVLNIRLLTVDEHFGSATLRIFNTGGKLVYSEKLENATSAIVIDICDFPVGQYLLNISAESGVFNRQFGVAR